MNKQLSKISSIAITLIISASAVALSITYLSEYNLAPLFIVPILIGFLPPFLTGGKYPLPKRDSFILSFMTLLFAILILIIIAIVYESMLLLFLAIILPFVIPAVWLFSYIAFQVNDRRIFKVRDFFHVLPIFLIQI